ncbi:hypothetical protein AGMMS50249_4630 [candidate division SR1 bacterium]|nr:hypothetical protein AGMMS50249_4630 [candidate division SR1 bacterium]
MSRSRIKPTKTEPYLSRISKFFGFFEKFSGKCPANIYSFGENGGLVDLFSLLDMRGNAT